MLHCNEWSADLTRLANDQLESRARHSKIAVMSSAIHNAFRERIAHVDISMTEQEKPHSSAT